jgi:hypothetical protein
MIDRTEPGGLYSQRCVICMKPSPKTVSVFMNSRAWMAIKRFVALRRCVSSLSTFDYQQA